jgi:diguanylate cyclase (GGDEF)-like protein
MGRFRLYRILACLLVFSAALQAQQYVFRAFRQPEGLKNLAVNAITIDRHGFLWVATENGVYRFLGSGFERYGSDHGIAELDARDVISDPDGTIWVATARNLYRWDGGRFLPAGPDPIPIEGPRRVSIEDARHLLVVQRGRPFRLEHDAGGKFVSILPLFPEPLLASMPDLTHLSSLNLVSEPGDRLRVWAGCGLSLCSWPAGRARGPAGPHDGIVTEWGRSTGLAADTWSSVILDRAGTLWSAGLARVAVLPAGAARFVDRSIPGSAPETLFAQAPLIEDRGGRILVPSGEGIARWDGGGWRFVGPANGLGRAIRIMGMTFDTAGDLWLASRGGGLYQWIGYADWEGWGDEQGLPSPSIWAIAPTTAGRVYVGTERGALWVDPRDGSSGSLSLQKRWPFGQISALGADSGGSWWAATGSGAILRIDPRTGRLEQTAKLPPFIITAFEDSAGRIFFETSKGIYLSEAGAETQGGKPGPTAGRSRAAPHRVPAADALLGDSTQVVAGCESPDGADWFAAERRLARFKNGQWTAPVFEGMPGQSEAFRAVSCARDGALWLVGARGGIWRLTPSGDRWKAWQLDLPPELRTLNFLAILVDRRGWVWLGTDLGLVAWNGQSWRHLTQESGLIWNDINQGILRESADGSLWIGTSGGLAHLLHPERVFDSVPLTVSVTGVWRGNADYSDARQITLPWAGPPLSFQVSAPEMRNRSELILKLRMAGLQPAWMEAQDGLAVYTRLAPGKYTFMAIACNPGLSACSAPVNVDIRILPPWWRTNWFYALCSLAVLFLLAAAHRLYAGHLRARGRELETLVRDRTHELHVSREMLRMQATHDGLTGMLNRTAILRALSAEMDRAQRENRTVLVALADLDFFKQINDAHGHLAGDEALRWFAAAVGTAIRAYDHAGRFGGEEFLLVLTEIPREAVEQRLASLHASISNLQVSARGTQFRVDCSMGATVFDPANGAASVESLLAIADQNLYAAKAAGRNRVVFRPADSSGPQHSAHEHLPTPR